MELDTLICGDSLEIMPDIPDGSIDMILCDLPYGTTQCSWDTIIPFEPLWLAYKRIIKPNGAIVLTATQPFTSILIVSNLDFFRYELIWNKAKGMAPGVAKYRPMPSHESILVFGKGTLTYNPQWNMGEPYIDKRSKERLRNHDDGHKLGYTGIFESISDGRRYPLSVITIPKTSKAGQHPTQKPVALFEYLIRMYTNADEVVLDNCIGSGTTAIACIRSERHYIGCDISEEYCEIARNRIAVEQMQPKLFNL